MTSNSHANAAQLTQKSTNLFWTAHWYLIVVVGFMHIEVRTNFIYIHFNLEHTGDIRK